MTSKLREGAVPGERGGNTYLAKFAGVAYDEYEANHPSILQEGCYPQLLTTYRAGARKLIRHASFNSGDKIIDLGVGTGIATLELLSQQKEIQVIAVEKSAEMLEVAKYKFHHIKGGDFLVKAEDENLKRYWQEFREESEPYKEKVEFVLGDFLDAAFYPESIDGAIANQFMHWVDLAKAFNHLRIILREKKEVIWNSASRFYNDKMFPAKDYGFKYNDFMKCVLNDVCMKGGFTTKDCSTLTSSTHDLKRIKEITSSHGFETEQIATYLVPIDLQVFIQSHVPVFVRQLIISEVQDTERLEMIIKEAIKEAVVNDKAMSDIKHKYDIVPVFKSVKR